MLKGHRAKYQLLPHRNLPCLQIAQSLHHNRWDSCLPSPPRPCNTHWPSQAHADADTRRCRRHQTLIADKTGELKHVLYTSGLSLTHTHTCASAPACLTSPARRCRFRFFSPQTSRVQGQRRLSAGGAAHLQQGHRVFFLTINPRVVLSKLPQLRAKHRVAMGDYWMKPAPPQPTTTLLLCN